MLKATLATATVLVGIAMIATALLGSFAGPAPARAESLACQTVNGKTVCLRGSGTLSCETINGNTRCSSSPADPPAGIVPTPARPPVAHDLREMLERHGLHSDGSGYTLHFDPDDMDQDDDDDLGED